MQKIYQVSVIAFKDFSIYICITKFDLAVKLKCEGFYCKSGNFATNLFLEIVLKDTCDIKKLRLGHDVPISVIPFSR